jgi:phosphatidate cytidylyltransferase
VLKARILTALVLGAIILGVVLGLPAPATIAMLTLVVGLGAWEWSAFLRPRSAAVRAGYVLLVLALLPVAWFATDEPATLTWFLLAAAAWWILALVWLALAPAAVTAIRAGLAGLLALVPAWIALCRLRLDASEGAALVLFALVLVVAADTGAFLAGRCCGRVRLAPRVSPGKTWEGALGGVALALLVGLWGAAWFGQPSGPFVAVCAAAAVFSIVGDLTESMLKRHAGIKDSGSLFPGHGGILDRIDSVTAGAPVLLLGLRQLGVAS